eukprot:2849377-Prymnesium_polylepis.1
MHVPHTRHVRARACTCAGAAHVDVPSPTAYTRVFYPGGTVGRTQTHKTEEQKLNAINQRDRCVPHPGSTARAVRTA